MANAFWDFSLKTYAAPGVAGECLSLQDNFGIDVNLLLFSAYMGAEGTVLTGDDMAEISALVRDWHEQVVKPLRSARRAIKQIHAPPSASTRKPVESLRNQVKALELDAEKIEQDMLGEWARTRVPVTSDAESAICRNIQLLLEFSGAAADTTSVPALLQASLAAVKPALARR